MTLEEKVEDALLSADEAFELRIAHIEQCDICNMPYFIVQCVEEYRLFQRWLAAKR